MPSAFEFSGLRWSQFAPILQVIHCGYTTSSVAIADSPALFPFRLVLGKTRYLGIRTAHQQKCALNPYLDLSAVLHVFEDVHEAQVNVLTRSTLRTSSVDTPARLKVHHAVTAD